MVPKAADLDAETREVLTAIAAAPLAWTYPDVGGKLRAHGLPDEREAFAAWLAR